MNRYIRSVIATIVILFAATGIYAANELPTLRVGYNSSLPPYQFEQNAKPNGLSISIMEGFAMRRGYRIKWIPLVHDELLSALLQNKLDLAVGMPYTELLRNRLEYSSSYITARTVVAFNPKSGIYEPAQLSFKRMVITHGLDKQYHIEALGIGDAHRYTNTIETLSAVDAYQQDATLAPEATVAYCKDHYRMRSLATIALPLDLSTICIAAPAGKLAIIQQFNEALQAMKADGTYDKIMAEWIDPYTPKVNPYRNLWWIIVLVLAIGIAGGGLIGYKFRKIPEPEPIPQSVEQLGVQGGGVGVWLIDLSTGIVRVNQMMLRLYSLPVDMQTVGVASFLRYIPEPHRRNLSQYLIGCSKGNCEEFGLIHPISTIAGDTHWLSSHASVVSRDEEGNASVVAGTCRDITEIIVSRNEYQELAEYYDLLLNSMNNVVLYLDEHLRVLRCNAYTERIFGIRRDRLVGLNFVTTFIPKVRQDDFRAWFILRLMNSVPDSIEENLVTSSGQIRRFRWSINRIFVNNKSLRWVMVGDDITGQVTKVHRTVLANRTVDLKSQLFKNIAQHVDTDDMLQSLADTIVDAGFCDAMWIGAYYDITNRWQAKAARAADTVPGFTVNTAEAWGFMETDSPVVLAGNTQQFYQLSQLSTNQIREMWWNHLIAYGIETIICQPIIWRDRLLGVMVFMRKAATPLEFDEQVYIGEIADALSFGMALAENNGRSV